eukprot:3938830-Rhodomonas_salina.1
MEAHGSQTRSMERSRLTVALMEISERFVCHPQLAKRYFFGEQGRLSAEACSKMAASATGRTRVPASLCPVVTPR